LINGVRRIDAEAGARSSGVDGGRGDGGGRNDLIEVRPPPAKTFSLLSTAAAYSTDE